jgi:hypothetical protein
VLLLKIALFCLDPMPKLYMGDSGSYLFTALTGWIPEDRSYLYGFVIRWSSLWCHSLTGLLLVQLVASTTAVFLFYAVCRSVFYLPPVPSYLAGVVCALDPLQLLYERYIMAEAISLGLYAGALYFCFRYLRDRRLVDLVFVQVLSVLLIAFRMSFLMVVQIDTILLPIVAFAGLIWGSIRAKAAEAAGPWASLRRCGGHLLASIAVMFALHTGYKQLTGFLAHREPAYLHATGLSLLAALSPILEPVDSSDPGLADLIRNGDEFEMRTFYLRNSQRFTPGRLVDRVSQLQPDPARANQIAGKAAMHALRRNPVGVAGLAGQTYAIYWDIAAMQRCATADFSFNNPPSDDLIATLAGTFNVTLDKENPTQSLLQRYYVAAWPYYFLILVAPLLAACTLLFRFGRGYAFLLFVHISLMLAISMLFGGESVRYFQPISYALLLALALLVRRFALAKPAAETSLAAERSGEPLGTVQSVS